MTTILVSSFSSYSARASASVAVITADGMGKPLVTGAGLPERLSDHDCCFDSDVATRHSAHVQIQ
jgi:hypothetical protein